MPDLLEELGRIAALPQALLLISSPLSLTRLAIHLQSWLNGIAVETGVAEGTELLVRYFDACIGMAMVNLWPAAERIAFKSAFDWWCGWSERFALQLERCGPRQSAIARVGPLRLNEAVLEQIDMLNRAERILCMVKDEDAEAGELDGIAPWLCRAIACNALAKAQALGLDSWSDQRIAIALALRVRADILEQPYMAVLIARAASNGGLANVVAAVPPGAFENESDLYAAVALEKMVRGIVTEMSAASHRCG